jgi:hypothetical protein
VDGKNHLGTSNPEDELSTIEKLQNNARPILLADAVLATATVLLVALEDRCTGTI